MIPTIVAFSFIAVLLLLGFLMHKASTARVNPEVTLVSWGKQHGMSGREMTITIAGKETKVKGVPGHWRFCPSAAEVPLWLSTILTQFETQLRWEHK